MHQFLTLIERRLRFAQGKPESVSKVDHESRDSGHSRIAELDVLRGFSALTVMMYHYTTIYVYGKDPGIPYGVLAVNLFFMISGFVIFMTLSHTRTALDFIVSRFSRLFPVFWAAVLISQTVAWLFPSLSEFTLTWHEALVNLTMLAGPLHVRWVDNVYWSLVVELTFYAIMLGLFLIGIMKHIERLVLPWLLLQVVAAMVSNRNIHIPDVVTVLFLLKYAHLFLAGILCYRIRFEGLTATRQMLLACCLATQFAVKGSWAGIFALFFFTLFYLMSLQRLGWIAVRPLVFLGTISYSLYLVHQNIGYVIMRSLATAPRTVQVTVAMVAALLLATLLTFMIERPALHSIRVIYKRFKAGPSSEHQIIK